MKTCDELANRWNSCQGGQILVDHSHPLKMYLNINESNHKELLVPVNKPVTSFRQTEAIGINNYKFGCDYLFSVELLTDKLSDEYVCLCYDLIESSRRSENEQEASTRFFETLKKWYSLLNAIRGNLLSINEIRGLMGELKYMVDEIEEGGDGDKVVNAWTIHKDASRDFIYEKTWDEVKTVQTSGDYITISSLEQLEHDSDGRLVVYKLDHVENSCGETTFNLNSIVDLLKSKLGIYAETELTRKLLAKGYSSHQEYEKHNFAFNERIIYKVDETFPKIGRNMVSDAICAARYDISMSKIDNWRMNNGQ